MGDLRDKVKTIPCASWTKLAKEFEQLSYAKDNGDNSHWIYRGHANADWWLKPSIELFQESLTAAKHPYSIRALEQQLLHAFQSSAPQFLVNLPSKDETMEWLAVLQHYGTPTRLLDWTYSPTVAAYFALRFEASTQSLFWRRSMRLGFEYWLVRRNRGWTPVRAACQVSDIGRVRECGRCENRTIFS